MKRTFALLSLLAAGCMALFAKPLDFVRGGEYVYYLDRRGQMNFYRGFLFASDEENTVIIHRSVDLDTMEERNLVITVYVDETGEAKIANVSGHLEKEEYTFFQTIPDILNFLAFYNICKDEITCEVKGFDDEWDNYVLVYNFGKLIPGFGFVSITEKGADNDKGYFLNRWGLIKNDSEVTDFLKLMPRDFTPADRQADLSIPNKKARKVTMNKMKATLDENWQSNDSEGQPGYWLSLSSVRDSQIMIEDFANIFPLNNEEDQLSLGKLSVLSTQTIKPDTIYAEKNKDGLFVSFDVYDENNFVSYMQFQIKNGKVINFSTFKDIYEANYEYYRKILNSVK